MTGRRLLLWTVTVALLLTAAAAVAQYGRGYGRREMSGGSVDRGGVPEWKNDERFKNDVFTFVRIRYSSYGRGGYGGYRGYGGGRWSTDYPDSDLNFSFRLQQLTALEVDPNGKILELTDPELLNYPWIYVIEPGSMYLDDAEVAGLRKYLLNGGFMMVDDFWGEAEWANFYDNIKRVFPDREPIELPLEHEIFHCVYDLKKKPQVPSIHSDWESGVSTDRPWDPTAREVHYRALFDDKGRMMAIICHNTDLGDGWEREGVSIDYFHNFSEKWSYPMGINIVTYAMTH
jgi:hypothetical protein